MVIAICPICKAQIEVDPKTAASICSACKQPIITENAIKEYMLKAFGHMISASTASEQLPVIDPNFQIEDGELTKYKGNRKEVKIPAGVKGIASCAFNDPGMERIFVPKSVEYLKKYSLRGIVTFEDGCVLKSIEPNAFYNVICLENFPALAEECYKGVPLFVSHGCGISVLSKSSESEFFATYTGDDIRKIKMSVGYNAFAYSENLLMFDYVKTVHTDDGWYVAVGKNEACIIGYDGRLSDTLIMPSECEGVKVTKLQNVMGAKRHWSDFKEIYLPEFLEAVYHSLGGCMLEAEKIHVPASIKYIGMRALKCETACFEERDGLPFMAVENIESGGFVWIKGASVVITPFLKSGSGERRYMTREEYIRKNEFETEKKRYNDRRNLVTFIADFSYVAKSCTVIVENKFEKLEYTIAPKEKKDIFIHPNDIVSVRVNNSAITDAEKSVPSTVSECRIKDTFFSWKLVCK